MRDESPAPSEPDLDLTNALLAEDQSNFSDDSDSAFIDAAQQASNRKTKSKNGLKSGGTAFQSMGLLPSLSKAISHKGFKVPTPIQRKTIPLILEKRDVVGMARTGSGKTAAFVIPMIQHLKTHTAKTGARAVIMSPSRELALQTLKVVKELGKGADLKTVLLVGGDSLEDHFAAMSGNPDIIIATPGRFLHIKVEMNLALSSVEYIVFDEADRLFEMGFASQLTEVLHALPPTRQTLLFSATLPVSLVEFAKAGLTDPVLVRLDVDSKISSDLESAFFSVQTTNKEGALLYILSDIVKLDTASKLSPTTEPAKDSKKRKRKEEVAPGATIIFTCTKHHVDYLYTLLTLAGYKASYIYGALDQSARRNQIDDFKSGKSNILVVTDVAARGIDIPILANVINYDFPAQPKIFVHRVGRTARAGKRGWSYSLVRAEDAAYLLDLQLFLSRRLVMANSGGEAVDYTKDVVLGALPRDGVERGSEWANKTISDDADLLAMKKVAEKGEKLYLRTRPTASNDSIRRAKEVIKSSDWTNLNPLVADPVDIGNDARTDMLKRVGNFRPAETVFEIGHRGNNEAANIMRNRRDKFVIDPAKSRPSDTIQGPTTIEAGLPEDDSMEATPLIEVMANESDIEAAFPASSATPKNSLSGSNLTRKRKRGITDFKDNENYMSHYDPSMNAMDHAYDVNSFSEAARHEALDLATDEGKDAKQNRGKKWDPKQKKFVNVANETDGSKGSASKMIRGESGVKIPASYSAGRYAAWKNSSKNKSSGAMPLDSSKDRRFKHHSLAVPKAADRFRDDYHAKKKQNAVAKEKGIGVKGIRSELKDKHQIRKERNEKMKRQEKNARPSTKKGRGGSKAAGRGGHR